MNPQSEIPNPKSITEPLSKKKINSLRSLVKLMEQGYLFTYALISAKLFGEVMQLDLCAVFDQIYNVGAAFQPRSVFCSASVIAAGKPLPPAKVFFWHL
jgi:hypothetical protein